MDNINSNTEEKRIYLRDNHEGDGRVLVAKTTWFKTIPTCELYSQYGLPVENNHEEDGGECCCLEVRAYNYWNGSNWQSVVIEADYDLRYSEIEDKEEIARYEAAIENMEFDNDDQTGYKVYTAPGFEITESAWQGDWELYTIQETEETEEEFFGETPDLLKDNIL